MILKALFLASLALPALAQAVPCDEHWGASLVNLSEPLEETTRAYANGEVRELILSAGEPACCGLFVAVLMPDPDGFRICRILTGPEDMGWGGVAFLGEASYAPARGLLVPMELSTWDGEAYDRTPARIVINRATGTVMVGP